MLSFVHSANPNLTAIVGSDDLETGDKYEIKQFHSHPDFSFATSHPDIAVVELTENMTFGITVQPIPLAEPDINIKDDAIFETMGFGQTEDSVSF